MTLLGLDIGYSNMKMCMGTDAKHQTKIMPVGVMPDEGLRGIGFDSMSKNVCRVLVDGKPFFAGVSPDALSGRQRTLHANYPSTVDYRAMFAAALLTSSAKEIDRLVTGLPVSNFLDAERVTNLKKELTGEFKITPKRTVVVNSVLVVPQPIGGYMNVVSETPNLEQMRVLVIDPGFFSVDWVVIHQGSVVNGTLGTSLKAVSVLLDAVSADIYSEHGGRVSVEDLEQSIRNGKNSVFLFGETIQIMPYLKKASLDVGSEVCSSILSSIREVKSEVDAVLLVGGGARLYHDSVKVAFPRSKIMIPENSVMSNAEGFWCLGLSVQ